MSDVKGKVVNLKQKRKNTRTLCFNRARQLPLSTLRGKRAVQHADAKEEKKDH